MIDYDDLRLLAAIAAQGDPRRAAAAERVHVATVYRRLRGIERTLGQAMFARIDGRYAPTALAAELIAAAETVRATLDALSRRVAGRDDRLVGTLSVTTTDTLLPLLTRALPPFVAKHPALTLDLAVGNALADMARHEADIAVRPKRTPPETLVGRRVGRFDVALYRPLVDTDAWIGFDESLASVPAAVWAAEHMGGAPRLRVNSLWAAAEAAAAGLGRAVLPAYLAREMPLERVGPPIAALASEVWILCHPDLRRTPRVRYFLADVAPVLAKMLAA